MTSSLADRLANQPNAFQKVTFRGKLMDRKTAAFLHCMELILGYELTVVQGCYHKGVTASAGTHDGGGAFDLAPQDWDAKVRAGRSLGGALWHRLPSEGPWGEHIHGVMPGHAKLSVSAKQQVHQYRNHTNGLANQAPDTFPYHPDVPSFSYQKYWEDHCLALQRKQNTAEAKVLAKLKFNYYPEK